jgi:hypothetical protein
MINKELILDIQTEMRELYNLLLTEDIIKDFLKFYHYDRIEDDPDYDGEFVFDTTEREDLLYYLEDIGMVRIS